MSSWDQTIVLGYIGNQPEIRQVTGGKKVCNFSVAVNRPRGRGETEAVWFRCSAWEKTAENIARYCKKGDMVRVDGNVTADHWTTRDGEDRVDLKLQVRSVSFLGGKSSDRPSRSNDADELRHTIIDLPYPKGADNVSPPDIPF